MAVKWTIQCLELKNFSLPSEISGQIFKSCVLNLTPRMSNSFQLMGHVGAQFDLKCVEPIKRFQKKYPINNHLQILFLCFQCKEVNSGWLRVPSLRLPRNIKCSFNSGSQFSYDRQWIKERLRLTGDIFARKEDWLGLKPAIWTSTLIKWSSKWSYTVRDALWISLDPSGLQTIRLTHWH